MKKIIAVLIVAIMLSIPFTALANIEYDNIGEIPKTAVAPTIDGVKDALYDNGLHIPVRNPHSTQVENDPPLLGRGADAWMLWDDAYWYVFINIDLEDVGNLKVIDPEDDARYAYTNVEFCIEFSNEGELRFNCVKLRVTDDGTPDIQVGQEGRATGNDAKAYYESAVVKGANNYTIEMKLNIAEIQKLAMTDGAEFGGPWEAGKDIGLLIFSSEVTPVVGGMFFSTPSDRTRPNSPEDYDYVVLGGTIVNEPVQEVVDEPAGEPELHLYPDVLSKQLPVFHISPGPCYRAEQ